MFLYDLISLTSYSFDFEHWFNNFDQKSNLIKVWKEKLLQAYASYADSVMFLNGEDYQMTLQLHLNFNYTLS